ncbi:MAG: microcystinase C [Pirellulaceae bacterium]|nr:MAG: microcystinase C [Pirellulaceae bacterium]
MRVGIVAILHESNTFIQQPTCWSHFQEDLWAEGSAVWDCFWKGHHEVSGFLAGLIEHGLQPVPLLAARAMPYGAIETGCYRRLLDRFVRRVAAAAPMDGWLVAVHGAAASHADLDVDGTILTWLRQVAADRPIIATVDAHANLSPRMVTACQAIIPYQTNPHLDQYERGWEAARLMARTLQGELHPVVAAAFPPMVINIERQATAEGHWEPIRAELQRCRSEPGILNASVVLGFPYADVPKMGSAVVVTADRDPNLARTAADRLAQVLWQHRHQFVGQMVSIDQAVRMVSESPPPVGLLDMGDNVGGGSPGDGTAIAHALRARRIRALVCLYDPQTVTRCSGASPGSALELSVGGKCDTEQGPPLEGRFTLRGMFEGKFTEDEPRHGAIRSFDQGPTVVLEDPSGLVIVATSRRVPPFSLKQITSCGLEPRTFQAIAIKGVHAPLAAYREVCSRFIRVDTPGVTCANLDRLPYRRRRRPLFPLEEPAELVTICVQLGG